MKKSGTLFLAATMLLGVCVFASSCDRGNRGITASYFNNPNWTGEPLAVKKVPTIDFIWYNDGEKPLHPPFGMVLEGQMFIPEEGDTSFYLSSDDGSDLSIDGTTLIDNLGHHINTEKEIAKRMTKGWHKIRVRYNELEGGAELHLSWKLPSGEKEIVPQRFLMPLGAEKAEKSS